MSNTHAKNLTCFSCESVKRMFFEATGGDFTEFMREQLYLGTKRLFSEFIVLGKNQKEILGQVRLK